MKKKNRVTKDAIERGLAQLGLKPGDAVGVHSALSSMGYVEGGADAVIDALLETVGRKGTIVMPAYSDNRKEIRRTKREKNLGVTWKYRISPYNPRETPCWTGKIAETFRKRKDAIRSLHPTHSIAAVGPKAREIAEAARESADGGWKKLLELDGYILLIGVGLEACSSMHLAEEHVKLPPRIMKKITPPLDLSEKYGPNLGWPNWDIGHGPYPDFAKMEQPCQEHGITKTAKIGEATVKLLKLIKLIDLYARYLRSNPDPFYCHK